MFVKTGMLIVSMVIVTAGLFAQSEAQENPNDVDGWVRLRNVFTQEWRIVDHGGEGVYVAAGVRVGLQIGGTYYFDTSDVESNYLPLVIMSRTGSLLFAQSGQGLEAERFSGADAEIDQDGIRFQLTEELARRISRFRAAPFPGMVGFIIVVGDDGASSTEEEGDDEA